MLLEVAAEPEFEIVDGLAVAGCGLVAVVGVARMHHKLPGSLASLIHLLDHLVLCKIEAWE